MRLPASDLALIRDSKSHYTDLHLSIFQPTIALQCQVNDISIARGTRSITFDNTTSGSWQNVKIGSTLLVGSSVGERNVGKVRVRSITSSVITVAENSHINWADNLFLTVLNYFDVWPIYPRIIQDPANSESTLWYKDYDVVYSNQNDALGAFINIGPHRAAFLEPATNNVQLYYSASGTYALSGAITSYRWVFEGGNPATSSANTPGYVTYTGSGHYLTTFEASGTNGWVETAYRYVSIYDRPSAGTNNPISKWELSDLSGSRGEGGWRGTITVFEAIEVEEGSVVVIFADEYYDSTNRSLGGNAPNASKIKFVGYVLDNSIRYNYKESSVSFEIGSISQVMKEMEGFAIELQSTASPAQWYEMADVNGKKATYHYWKWHSNVLMLTDVEWIGDDYLVQFFDSDRESLWDAADNFLRTTYIASAVCDRQGKIWMETDAYARPDATGTFSPIFNMTSHDWIETPEITERRYNPVSYLEFGGIAYSGVVTGTYEPLMSEAPGSAPNYRGKVDRRQGLALSGQTQLNELTGNVYTYENSQYPAIDFQMRGNWSNLDIAPQEAVGVNISASDTARGEAISGLYLPSNLIWSFNPENKVLLVRGSFNVITTGEAGTTIDIPDIIDSGGYGDRASVNGLSIPQIQIPSIPIAGSVYAALKLQTNGPATTALPPGAYKELALTQIEFSTIDSSLTDTTASGTFSGIIVPIVGASGTWGVNYGFLCTLPGIYRIGFNMLITDPFPPEITNPAGFEGIVFANNTGGSFTEQFYSVFPVSYSGQDITLQGETVYKMPTNGVITILVQNHSASNSFVMYHGTATVEFMKYEP